MLLELAFVILLHLLVAPPAVPGTHTDEDTKGKKDENPPSHHEHLRQDKLYIKENEGILHEVKISPAAYRRDVPCSCP